MAGGRRDLPQPSATSFADGAGDTLGEAILDCLNDIPRGRLVVSVSARFRQLSKTRSGFADLEAAGLAVSPRTIQRWLAGTQTPGKRNAAIIDRAYIAHRRRPSSAVINRFLSAVGVITGLIRVSDDHAERTVRIPHATATMTAGFVSEWRQPDPNPDVLEQLYIDWFVEPAFRAYPEFPGRRYRFQLE